MLTLLCPDALPEADDSPDSADTTAANRSAGASVPLARLLRRARVLGDWVDPQVVPRLAPVHRWLAARFQLGENWHPGAMRALDAQGDNKTFLTTRHMVMTPAHLHAGLDHLVLQPPSTLVVTPGEAQALVETTNRFFEADNLVLHVLSPGCWLMESAEPFSVHTCDHAMAIGRNIDAYLPGGPAARKLRSVLNEMQMLWHDHPVNQARLEQHQPAINTLWAEGYLPAAATGSVPASTPPHVDVVVSADPVTRGLARFVGAAVTGPAEPAVAKLPGTLASPDQSTLLELPPGPAALAQVLNANPSLEAELVLTNSQRWLHLRIARGDRLRLWRRTALTPAT